LDISPFVQTAFGAIVGGSIVVATNWLTARAERKRHAQEWWEQKYVSEGVDHLITYLKSVQLYSANMNLSIGHTPPLVAKPQEVPLDALTRTESFLHMDISGISVDRSIPTLSFMSILLITSFHHPTYCYSISFQYLVGRRFPFR
jgi:hypothetical protein